MIRAAFQTGNLIYWEVCSNVSDSFVNKNIDEFYSAYYPGKSENAECNFSVNCVGILGIPQGASLIQEHVYLCRDTLFIKDKYKKNGLLSIYIGGNIQIEVTRNFTFYYYAKLLDELIRTLAVQKNILFFHAGSYIKNGCLHLFGAWRRVGKTTVLLETMRRNKVQMVSDDALLIDTVKREAYPYIRGIDFYYYLPLPENILTGMSLFKYNLSKLFIKIPVAKKIIFRILKRYFTPRINLAKIQKPERTYSFAQIEFNALALNDKKINEQIPWNINEAESFFKESSFHEFDELQKIFQSVININSDSGFKNLYINKESFMNKYKQYIQPEDTLFLLKISNDYNLNGLNL